MEKKMISIWFFIGGILAVYGLLIVGAAIYDWVRPAARPVVMSQMHAGIWWGGLLIVLGIIYIIKFRPRRPTE